MDAWMYFIKLCFAVMKPMAFELTAKVYFWYTTHNIREQWHHSLCRIDRDISDTITKVYGNGHTLFPLCFIFLG